jgi:hypothetical protein
MAKSPRMHYKSWTPADVRSLKKLAKQGASVSQIAKELQRTTWAVRNRASSEGVSVRASA